MHDIGGVIMKKVVGLRKKYKLSGSCVAISTSNKYMVRSTDRKIYLSDFKTNQIIKTIKSDCVILRNISPNDKYCVGTFNGELGIKVFNLPELEEVVSLDVAEDEYVVFVDFLSDAEFVYCVRVRKEAGKLYTYNIETGKLSVVYTIDYDKFCLPLQHPFWNDGLLCIPLQNKKNENALTKFVMWDGKNFQEKEIPCQEDGNFYDFSNILNNKILFNKYIEEGNVVLGVYDFDSKEFTPISSFSRPIETYWVSDDLFWFSQVNVGKLGRSGLMNLKGEIQIMHDTFSFANTNCNEDYFIVDAMSSYVYEKIYEYDDATTKNTSTN